MREQGVYRFGGRLLWPPTVVHVDGDAAKEYEDAIFEIQRVFCVTLERGEMTPSGTCAEAEFEEATLHVAHVTSYRVPFLHRHRDLDAVLVMASVPSSLPGDVPRILDVLRDMFGDEDRVVHCGPRWDSYKWVRCGDPIL